jgi:acyl-CoA thioester hydrolase
MKNRFNYYHPITVRYGDLDPQGHVNNAAYLTYAESARLGYYQATGIWRSDSGVLTGMVVAHIDIDYLAPINLGQEIRVGIRLARIGNKSLTLDFQMDSLPEKNIAARGTSVMVAYDNKAQKSIPFPLEWREKLLKYEENMEDHDAP